MRLADAYRRLRTTAPRGGNRPISRMAVALGVSAAVLALVAFNSRPLASAASLPARLSDADFWTLSSMLSEPDGDFHSDNLMSNEVAFQSVIPGLKPPARGQVYLGVGPEQNFSYIAALQPSMAFIIDIRRANLDLHLMYKALFELSANRRDFVSRLFSRPLPSGLGVGASAAELFDALAGAAPDEAIYRANLSAIEKRLVSVHHFQPADGEIAAIERAYRAFFIFGPRLRYSVNGAPVAPPQPTYADLMTASAPSGQNRSYLSTEHAFDIVKDLESRNVVVPVVADFAGPSAIRKLAVYLHDRRAGVSAFYVSNVEEYLRQERSWQAFCANVARLPIEDGSTFIRARAVLTDGLDIGFATELAPIAREILSCRE